ncbi:MAG: NINE protein [Gemmatimonadota bacterium]|nr:MAG: NINE protein [Gemmatimonadota bacterium]
MASTDASDRSRGIALALATVLGPFGAHRFYVGKIGTGLCQLATIGGLGIWWLYDWILVVAGSFRDADDRRVVNWAEGEATPPRLDGETAEKLEMLIDEMYSLREEMGDLGERVDFMERMLASVRQREAIPPGSV